MSLKISLENFTLEEIKRNFEIEGFDIEGNKDQVYVSSLFTPKFLFLTWGTCLLISGITFKQVELGRLVGEIKLSKLVGFALAVAALVLIAFVVSDQKEDAIGIAIVSLILFAGLGMIVILSLRSSLRKIASRR